VVLGVHSEFMAKIVGRTTCICTLTALFVWCVSKLPPGAVLSVYSDTDVCRIDGQDWWTHQSMADVDERLRRTLPNRLREGNKSIEQPKYKHSAPLDARPLQPLRDFAKQITEKVASAWSNPKSAQTLL